MVFSSIIFLFVYLPIVLVVMKTSPLKLRNLFLFLLSLVFYGWGEPFYIVLLLISTVVDYINGYFVYKYRDQKKIAKRFVLFSIVFNLGLLGFFKYYDFIISSLNGIGFELLQPLGLALPIGISFYTFQTMSYPIDIYRGQAEAQKSMVSFGAYVAMFPQLIAGPIVRYRDIAEQLVKRDETMDKFTQGIQRFMIGLSKKVLLANNIGLVFETIKSASSSQMSILTMWLGIIAYGFQIYFDFSGYSDMAIGLGKMFGFELLENFNYPYISKSITEFWRRWHISLGSWFRDYVYIPLGGNRCSQLVNMRNILVVWLLTGLWHGASWNFILWGLYFGILLMIEKLFLLRRLQKAPAIVQHTYTIILVLISWVIFAFEDLGVLKESFRILFGFANVPFINDYFIYLIRNNFVLLIVLIISATPLFKMIYQKYIEGKKLEWITPILILGGLILCTAFIVDASYNPFLYFRF
ncbi:alginate O-acetyltransferase complex protein AlgI [Anaerorhabdus furcosa]|uniref:Alginate O-acetyltransferase complex protein AlgI n=2 Tax=Anaerorhabdus furcosa TaxID=118967 RepID=A0A1T4LK09_9FIRM|nr:MBOAT family O-acyltransferase [Anaerorhabdus furcosa]SJZ55102.1 alginate O-acetyltransferase complex protein AlgI [Anaerorhabdus furcosa]